MKRGQVYIFSNAGMPGLVKVGGTARDVDARARELSSTGLPSPFKVEFNEWVSDWRDAEARAHVALGGYRVSSNREFFRISVVAAVDLVRAAILPLATTRSSVTVPGEIQRVGLLKRGRIVECFGAPAQEQQWDFPAWASTTDAREYKTEELLSRTGKEARIIKETACTEVGGVLWVLLTDDKIVGWPVGVQEPEPVVLYRVVDRHREALLGLLKTESVARSQWENLSLRSIDAKMSSFWGKRSGAYRHAKVLEKYARLALDRVGQEIATLQCDPKRWALEEVAGYWAFDGKVYQLASRLYDTEEAAVIVRHFAKQEAQRISRLAEDS